MSRRHASLASLALLAPLLSACLNVDVVDPGRVYRSSQPTPNELRAMREDYERERHRCAGTGIER